jgi:hypothetical protein
MMFKIIQTLKYKSRLRETERSYMTACNDLACYKSALPRAIKNDDDRLASALRESIIAATAECNRLKSLIVVLKEWLKQSRAKNVTMTT